MAKENTVWLEGFIGEAPKIKITSDGVPVRAEAKITTLKRLYSNGTKTRQMEFSFPKIRTKNEAMIKIMAGLKIGDYVRIKGVFSTERVNKVKACPCEECRKKGIKNSTVGIMAYVTPLFIEIMDRELITISDDGKINNHVAIEKLKERSEVSNNITCIGALVREVDAYTDPENPRIHATKYQIAVNRKYTIPEDGPDVKTDYPYVVSYGTQAVNDAELLGEGSVVYINGFLRSKNVKRQFVCKECGLEYDWIDPVLEIIPWGVEFLFKNKDEVVEVEEYAEDKLANYIKEYANI